MKLIVCSKSKRKKILVRRRKRRIKVIRVVFGYWLAMAIKHFEHFSGKTELIWHVKSSFSILFFMHPHIHTNIPNIHEQQQCKNLIMVIDTIIIILNPDNTFGNIHQTKFSWWYDEHCVTVACAYICDEKIKEGK